MTARNKAKRSIPKHSSEDAERKFWSESDSTDYIDWDKSDRLVLPKLKPSLKTISIRLPENMLAELRLLANKRDVPYQSLLKMFLADRLDKEFRGRKPV
ncbi:MAG: BrnA antitoxin family protein [Candidatus Delongbacteria bacterium]|nr:BrnA antitoxin family protein [bacterium]MBL7034095.1 BrnA antitoxin family protein [Candidatus Delongbacteria bacterium]